jgi:hypothetical protein
MKSLNLKQFINQINSDSINGIFSMLTFTYLSGQSSRISTLRNAGKNLKALMRRYFNNPTHTRKGEALSALPYKFRTIFTSRLRLHRPQQECRRVQKV